MNRATSIFHTGQITVGLTVLPLRDDTTPLTYGVTVKADAGNTDNVFVGRFNVTDTTGFILDAGEEIFIPADQLGRVHVIADGVGQKVHYVAS